MARYIMAIDQGTTSSRTCIIDNQGKMIAEARESFKQIFPKPGWVEHDPEDIWYSTQRSMRLALEKAKLKGREIAAIGITNQRETIVAWDAQTQKPHQFFMSLNITHSPIEVSFQLD